MLWKASDIEGYHIAASDGPLGAVSDFLFDDESWLIRWVVVDTNHWLPGRTVLLPAFVLGHIDKEAQKFTVKLTMQEVKDSPDVDTQMPVSRQMETNIFDYYGWSPYWGSGYYLGGYGGEYVGGAIASSPALEPPPRDLDHGAPPLRSAGDPHLRSVKAVAGYHIHARDGEIGHLKDFLVNDADWSIHFLVVDTKNWWPGEQVLISPRLARKIDWATNMVNLKVGRKKVKESPAYDPSTGVGRSYEKHFHSFYGDDLGTD